MDKSYLQDNNAFKWLGTCHGTFHLLDKFKYGSYKNIRAMSCCSSVKYKDRSNTWFRVHIIVLVSSGILQNNSALRGLGELANRTFWRNLFNLLGKLVLTTINSFKYGLCYKIGTDRCRSLCELLFCSARIRVHIFVCGMTKRQIRL